LLLGQLGIAGSNGGFEVRQLLLLRRDRLLARRQCGGGLGQPRSRLLGLCAGGDQLLLQPLALTRRDVSDGLRRATQPDRRRGDGERRGGHGNNGGRHQRGVPAEQLSETGAGTNCLSVAHAASTRACPSDQASLTLRVPRFLAAIISSATASS